ncbi:hypothetical protein [Niallia sp. 03133]|uniref:hypothetical protein n=1 Tax=Niallia sp. 03133 TaxID=3458060 RepID=UPI0040439687
MKLKKLVIPGLIVGLISTQGITAYASPLDNSQNNKTQNQAISNTIDINNLDESNTIVSDVMTFDEMVKKIASDENKSEKAVKDELIASSTKNLSSKSARTSAAVSVQSATYRTLSSSFTVNTNYKPTLNFYCQTTEGGGFRAIVAIKKVTMNRSYNGTSHPFGGSVYTNLEDPNRIYWIVEGDFYDNGTTTGGGAVDIKVGGALSINFNISYASNWYAYCYKTGYTYF